MECRVLLIGGSSHAGKSTLAQLLASQLGWRYLSTDKLARHPGRPWRTRPEEVPQHVAEHYLSLSPAELITDVLRHYKDNVWPLIESLVYAHATNLSIEGLVLEGSALLPELVVTLPLKNIAAIWITASNELFKQRIYRESQYETKSPREKAMIDKFLERTWLYDEQIMADVKRLGLVSLEVGDATSIDHLVATCLSLVQS